MNQLIRNELLSDETILWSGQPDANKIFTKGDIYLIPFSIMWGGFAIFWEFTALKGAPFFFALFGIPFVIMGLYLVFGRFFYKHYLRENTYYYVTQKRIIILKDTGTRKIEAEYISAVPCINKDADFSGYGTIIFGNSSGGFGMYNESGLDFITARNRYGTSAPAFYDIEQADEVYKIVNEIRNSVI